MKPLIRLISAGIVVAVCSPPGLGQISATISGKMVVALTVKPHAARAELKAVTISNSIFTVLALDASTHIISRNIFTTRRVAVGHLSISAPIPAPAGMGLGVSVTTTPYPIERDRGSGRAPPSVIAPTRTS